MQGLGRLDQYTTTQVVDFAFIATVLLLHSLALLWASRLLPQASKWCRFLRGSVLVAAVAPLADVLESRVSFVMLSDPGGFHPAWALLYSSLAALKFAAFSYPYLAFALGLVAAAGHGRIAEAGPNAQHGAMLTTRPNGQPVQLTQAGTFIGPT